jgi:hypothetical protein
MCTCGAFLHLHLTCRTRRLTCHLCLWTLLHPTCGTWQHLSLSHPICGTQRLACHLLPLGFNKFQLKKTMRARSQTQDPEQRIDHLHHYARSLVVLTCLWSSICSLCGQDDLYIGYIPCKWKQIYTYWTCSGDGGNGGSPMCCGGSCVLLEARRWVFLVEHGGTGIRIRRVPQQRWQFRYIGLLSRLFLFASLFWSLLKHEVYKKHCSILDLVRLMMMKRTRRWHWLVFCWCVSLANLSWQTNKRFILPWTIFSI